MEDGEGPTRKGGVAKEGEEKPGKFGNPQNLWETATIEVRGKMLLRQRHGETGKKQSWGSRGLRWQDQWRGLLGKEGVP